MAFNDLTTIYARQALAEAAKHLEDLSKGASALAVSDAHTDTTRAYFAAQAKECQEAAKRLRRLSVEFDGAELCS